jgi:DNA-binding SARP family transcriptional activator
MGALTEGKAAAGGVIMRLLGPVEVVSPGGALAGVAQPMLRVLVAMLGMAADRVVPVEALVDALWGEERSREREQNLQTHVTALRRMLVAGEPGRSGSRVERSGGGYRLVTAETEVDAGWFRSLAGRGRNAARAGDLTAAAGLFRQALGLWRGEALADVVGLCPRLVGDAAALEELRAGVLEERVECDLALGWHAEVAVEGTVLAAQFPFRERLAWQLMVALYRCGRRGEALTIFDSARRVLAEQLDLDPGPELAQLHAKVLADDSSLAPPAPVPATEAGVTAVVPAGAGAERVPLNNLPAQPATFIGRDRELPDIRTLMASARLVALTGAGGCGKTRLGLKLAADLLDDAPDGVWLVELAAITSDDDVVAALSAALGISRQPGRPVPAHAMPLYGEAIACTQRSGDLFVASFVNNNAALEALRAGDIPAARAYLHVAAQARLSLGDEHPYLSINNGWVLRLDNDPEGARASFQAAPADKPPQRRPSRYRLCLPRPGLPGHGRGRMAAGGHVAWRRADVSRSNRPAVGRTRSARSPRQP